MNLDAIAGSAQTGAGNSQRAAIAENFDAFLNLLVTQLRNQNPLDPLDTNEFTQQLVQFASVEQQIQSNDNLRHLTGLMAAQTALSTVGYIGNHITAAGATTELRDGQAEWSFDMPAESPEARITITDASGNQVYSETMRLAAGRGSYVWDGRATNGQEMAPGRYTITIDAEDADGNYLDVSTEIVGRVDAVDFDYDQPMLKVGGITVPLSAVTSVTRPGAES